MLLLISYDLNGYERPSAYAAVKQFIERNAISYRRPLYSQWLVETANDWNWWQAQLLKIMDSNDRLFICRVFSGTYQGYLDQDIWPWASARM
ncbi:hypothetical protein [Myxococcus stipitatus]|uniref:hypothetical protein n=1 Tax=Myxococcus stipitatus TaxID=83455 RepID=UPI0030D0F77D